MRRNASNDWKPSSLADVIDWLNREAEVEKRANGSGDSIAPQQTMIGRVDAAGRCIHQNQAVLDFLGWPLDKARKDWAESIHPEDRPRVNKIVNESLKAQRDFHFRLPRETRLRRISMGCNPTGPL